MTIPQVSVLVCTRNRAAELIHVLKSIIASTFSPFEVIVIDQSDDNSTSQVVEACQREIGANMTLRYVATDTRGLSRARNIGIAEARAPIIAFTDDDCLVSTDWVQTIARLFQEDVNLSLVYGQVLIPDEYKNRSEIVVPCLFFETRREIKKGDIFGMGANMAFLKSLTEKIGVYDTLLGAGSAFGGGEDFDFTYRAQMAGMQVVAEPMLTVIHKSFRTRDHWDQVIYAYGRGDAAFYGKHARCGDAWAGAAIRKRVGLYILKGIARTILFKNSGLNWSYLRGFREGLRQSNAHAVDTSRRLYIAAERNQKGNVI